MHPRAKDFGEKATGGVFRVVHEIEKRMSHMFGVQYVDRVSDADITHYHALSSGPKIDVYHNHGIWPNVRNQPDNVKIMNAVMVKNIVAASKVISVAQWGADQYKEDLGVVAEVIPNGVDTTDIDHTPRGRFKARHGIVTPMLLWAKAHLAEDSQIVLDLAQEFPGITFVTTLLPPDSRYTPSNVIVTGVMPYKTMKEAIVDCDVYISSTRENCPTQLLEAMAARKPCLAKDIGGNSEIVLHKKTGYLYKNDAVAGVEFCLRHAEKLGSRARVEVEAKYLWSQIIPKIHEIYQEAYRLRQVRLQSPRVSFVIPCYNYEQHLRQAVTSALSNTYQDIEVIIVDDGSKDNSYKIAKQLEKEHPDKVKAVKQRNKGVAAARNKGISLAKGEFIVPLDADDMVSYRYIETVLPLIEKDDRVGIAHSGMGIIRNNSKPKPSGGNAVDGMETLIAGNKIFTCSMFRKTAWERVGGYKKDVTKHWAWEDYIFWLDILAKGYTTKYTTAPVYYYRVHNEGRVQRAVGHELELRRDMVQYSPQIMQGQWGYGANANAHRKEPLVSVIIPCYNHSHFLLKAIQSVYAQTFSAWEIIIVDDCSTDSIDQVLQTLTDYRIRVVKHYVNRGLAEARNSGIRVATGNVILPLDADDLLESNAMALMYRRLEKERFRRYIYGDIWMFDGPYKEPKLVQTQEYDFQKLLNRITSPCTIMYPKEAWETVGGYKNVMSQLGGWEDYEFALALGEAGFCGVRIPHPTLWYRQYADGKSMKNIANTVHRNTLKAKLKELYPEAYGGRLNMCCGGGRRRSSRSRGTPAPPAPAVGDVPMVKIRYTGSKTGSQSFRGGVTPTTYKFSALSPVKYVDERDAHSLIERYGGAFVLEPQ